MATKRFLWLRILLRVALSALFVVSAVAKLAGIDHFELYVFSFGFFSLNFCYILVRLCIAAEFLVGLLIALGWFPRTTRMLTIGLLLFFSLFLCYTLLIHRTDSCQCFGQWVDIKPAQSLLKNALLLVTVFFYYRLHFLYAQPLSRRRFHLPVSLVAGIAVLVAVFSISVPDNWLFRGSDGPYNKQAFAEAIGEGGALEGDRLTEGRQLVAFVTRGCQYCQMTRQKLSSIASRHDIDTTLFHYYEPRELPDDLFVEITYGARPLVLLLDGGNVVATYHFRNINERQMARFFGR